MKSKYETFDRSQLLIKPLSERKHDMGLDYILKLDEPAPEFSHPQLPGVAQRLIAARNKGAARILMMGAHVIKSGASRYVIDLIERGYIYAYRHEWRGGDSRLRTGAHRRHHGKRGALHPQRRIRPLARNRWLE